LLQKLLKLFLLICFVVCSFYILFLNLGKLLDVTSKPHQADIVVCLGGGDYKSRIVKTVEVYKQGFITKNTIILTGYVNSSRDIKQGKVVDKRMTYLQKHLDTSVNVILNKQLKSTAEEVMFVKNYLIEHHLKSALFITEPPHSRRILLLNSLISIKGDDKLAISIVASKYKNWNPTEYYKDKYTKNYVFSEVVKIIYALFAYGFLDKLGLLEWFIKHFDKEAHQAKIDLTKAMNFISS